MKLLILTEGGKNIGFGHITRCVALSQAFEEANTTFVVNGDNSVNDFLPKNQYQIFDWSKKQKELMIMIKESDLAIIDSYLAPKLLYDDISEALFSKSDSRNSIINPLLIIDDYKRINYLKGVVVNPSIYGDSINYPDSEGVRYLLGKDYIILRKEFCNIFNKAINKEVKNILVTFGGINRNNFMKNVLKILSVNFPDFTYHIIANYDLNLDLNLNSKFYFNLPASRIRELMLEADICISGGGQTIYELARIGLPTVGICFADNQKLNLNNWHNEGFIEYVGCYDDDNLLEKIVSGIDKFIPHEERVRRSEIGKSMIDGKGADRIIKAMLS